MQKQALNNWREVDDEYKDFADMLGENGFDYTYYPGIKMFNIPSLDDQCSYYASTGTLILRQHKANLTLKEQDFNNCLNNLITRIGEK